MKPSFMFNLFLLSIILYQAQGIRFKTSLISSSNHQELITKTTLSIEDDESARASNLSPGIDRKLMAKILSSDRHSTNSKNYKPQSDLKFTHRRLGKDEKFSTTSVPVSSKHGKTEIVSEPYPDVVDITGMDYSPAKRKPPIHN
ncbi:uncharacterized protein LOC111882265 [Lactuca sativa]|uniref:uncharacterized protein LOC111882265 n=1 Tax=Lactuca sativa TaxID=4236 RepID=UPI000CC5B2B5|nr:uncharacterized protein LOC111882265 [Lactuca sativa]